MLLLGREPFVSSQVHIRGAQASQRGRLVVYRCVLVLLWVYVHVSQVLLTLRLISPLLGQGLHEALGAHLLRLDLCTFVNIIIPFICAFSLVPDRRCRRLVFIDDTVVEGLVQDIRVPESVGTRPLARVQHYCLAHGYFTDSLFSGHILINVNSREVFDIETKSF